MRVRVAMFTLGLITGSLAVGQVGGGDDRQLAVPLVIPAGVPLRLYLTKRVPKKMGIPVEARVLEPVYAFDHLVIPAGAVVLGNVSRLEPISKSQRTRAILGGDLTPLHMAPIEFTTLVMPDGSKRRLHTAESLGLNSIVPDRPPRKQAASASRAKGIFAAGKQKVHEAIEAQIDQLRSIPDLVRGPNKREVIEDYLLSKLPYHSQAVRRGTRFDAELLDPLSFGTETLTKGALAMVGTQPQADGVARVRLITPLDSASSKRGDAIEAVLADPLFSSDHKLVLPEGTRFRGSLVASRRARWFHRGGQLRFNFREIELPAEIARLQASDPLLPESPRKEGLKIRTQASLQAAESTGSGPLKVDSEGGVQANESKARLLAATAAVLIARSAADNDAIHNHNGQVVGQDSNVTGRTLGGSLGFGLLGAAISQSSRYVGTAFGYYGMARSLYSNIFARGADVQFNKNSMIDIRFNARPDNAAKRPANATKPTRGRAAK